MVSGQQVPPASDQAPPASDQSPAASDQAPTASDQAPPVRVTYLNVCTPSDDEKEQIAAALARIPKQSRFVPDFEIARGLASLQNATSRYVRLRREFPADSKLTTVQYSIGNDGKNLVETLVFSGRDIKEMRQLSIEESVSASTMKPSALIAAATPASRIKVERFGKSSLALARCEQVDQSKYQFLFTQASALLTGYRRNLELQSMLSHELAWLAGGNATAPPAKKKPRALGRHK